MTEADEAFDQDSTEIDRLIEAADAAYRESECYEALVEHLSGWAVFAEGIMAALEAFRGRMSGVSTLLEVMTEEQHWHFLRGSQYCAVMGAYERFVHQVFELMILRDEHFQAVREVLANDWPKNDKHQRYVVLSKLKQKDINNLSRAELAEIFRNTTLNDATRVASSVEKIFGLTFPVPPNFEQVCAIRNVFTHNGGVLPGGQLQPLSRMDVHRLSEEIDGLVADYAKALQKKAEEATGI